MDIRKLKTILELFESSTIREMEFVEGEERIRLCKDSPPPPPGYGVGVLPPPVAGAALPPATETPAATDAAGAGADSPAAESGQVVKTPMVGTFYRAAGPDKAPFVNVGDSVREGDILCIIEAMKLMNEIPSPVSGRVKAIYPDNGEGVGFGAELFLIE